MFTAEGIDILDSKDAGSCDGHGICNGCDDCDAAMGSAMDSDLDEVDMSTGSETGTTTPPEHLFLPTDQVQSEREIGPTSSHDVVFLNMTPFSPGQNAISNQNRLVANEVIFAAIVRGLQDELQILRNQQVNMDLGYGRSLVEHKEIIDKTTALMLERYKYCRDNLSGLVRFVNQSNTAHQQAIMSLKRSSQDRSNGEEGPQAPTCDSADTVSLKPNSVMQHPFSYL